MLKISSCFTCNSVALIKRAENTGNCPKDVHSYGNKGLLEGGWKSRELKGWKKISYHSRLQNTTSKDGACHMKNHFHDILPEWASSGTKQSPIISDVPQFVHVFVRGWSHLFVWQKLFCQPWWLLLNPSPQVLFSGQYNFPFTCTPFLGGVITLDYFQPSKQRLRTQST